MGTVHDPDALARYREILGYYRYRGYIEWKRVAREWLDRELANHTAEMIHEVMYRNVDSVVQVIERRPEYLEYRFHYDFRLPLSGRRIYVETVLIEDDDVIRVVSIHDA
jgi:hypothetical protein